MTTELTNHILEEENSLARALQDKIPDDASYITIKISLAQMEMTPDEMLTILSKTGCAGKITHLKDYIRDLGVEILYSSAGLHLKGKAKVPHVHWNLITTPLEKIPSNPSQHRTRWLNKNPDARDALFKDISIQMHHTLDLSRPKYSVLSYPLKEGHVLHEYNKNRQYYVGLGLDEIQMLTATGTAIYEAALAQQMRRDMSEDRRRATLHEMYDVAMEHRNSFTTFREMCLVLDLYFIENLDLEDFPDPVIYKKNCQRIAVKLELLKYSDLV